MQVNDTEAPIATTHTRAGACASASPQLTRASSHPLPLQVYASAHAASGATLSGTAGKVRLAALMNWRSHARTLRAGLQARVCHRVRVCCRRLTTSFLSSLLCLAPAASTPACPTHGF